MKTFNHYLTYVLFFITITVITGCGTKPPPEPIYVTNTEKVYITVPCKSEVKIRCNWSDTEDKSVVRKMLICISDLKLRDEFCTQGALTKHIESIKNYTENNTSK